MSKKIHLIAAARPNFMKIAPLYHELVKHQDWLETSLIHTGQHYDANMSDAFFNDLNLPKPHVHLEIGSGSHAQQTGNVMIAYEKVVQEQKPDMVVVVGDVNSTIACTLAASKIHYADHPVGRPLIAHLEAGLRSNDKFMPEEINRLATDVLSDILWTPSMDANENLQREGVAADKVVFVGNIMIDSFEMQRDAIAADTTMSTNGLQKQGYVVVTLHRPSNVDYKETLGQICDVLIRLADKVAVVFPVHPRTRKNLQEFGLLQKLEAKENIVLMEPVGYVKFMNLVSNSKFVLTDSGGVQEESTYLQLPCITLRPNTERPITVSEGTNTLSSPDKVQSQIDAIFAGNYKAGKIPKNWDGKTAQRIYQHIEKVLK